MVNYRFKDGFKKDLSVGKIVCLARTYRKHAEEMNSNVTDEPLLFLKPASSVIFDGESIIIPKVSNCLHHEVELGVVIGKKCKNVKERDAMQYVLGYLLGLDITARDIQSEAKRNGWPWGIAKGFDTFAPISSVVLKEKVSDPHDLNISLMINDKVRQKSNTSYMIYSIGRIIEFISSVMTLEVGDLILTGTPGGVAEIKSGDVLKAELGDICTLRVNVR